jgi:hypothetical protein
LTTWPNNGLPGANRPRHASMIHMMKIQQL